MPIFLPAIAVIAAGRGIQSSWQGVHAMRDASVRSEASVKRDAQSHERMENTRKATEEALENLGQAKAEVASAELGRFVDLFSMLKNVELEFTNDEQKISQGSTDVADIDTLSHVATEVLKGTAGGAAAGAFAGFTAYGAVGTLATASTGTAISTLSGAAATNATLAWLGGGSLASGGMGMAGGSMVLGGVVAGPLLLIGGGVLKHNARKNLAKIEQFEARVENAIGARSAAGRLLAAIRRATDDVHTTLLAVAEPFDGVLDSLRRTIAENGVDYATFAETDRHTVHQAFLFAQVTKRLIETQLLGEDGELLEDYKAALESVDVVLGDRAVI